MSTAAEFPENHWERLREEMERGGASAAIAYIESIDESDRLKLYGFAQRAFGGREWKGKNFDDYIAVAEAAIAEALRRSEQATDPARAAELKDAANIFSYNMAADLAECWPGDDAPRERRHFEAGARAATNCVRWREELGKTPDKRSMAAWARGIHLLSLRDLDGAVAGFRSALDYARQHAASKGEPTMPGADASFDINLNAGYLGMAETMKGIEEGAARYREACEAFEAAAAGAASEHARSDASFGLAQLAVVEKKLLGTERAAATAAPGSSSVPG